MVFSFNDVTGLTLYALLYTKGTSDVWNVPGFTFEAFNPSSIADYVIYFVENPDRPGYYEADITEPLDNMGRIVLQMEVWQEGDSGPDLSTNIIKGVQTLVWDGLQELGGLSPYRFESKDFIGVFTSGQILNTNLFFYDQYGLVVKFHQFPFSRHINFLVRNGNDTTVSTGFSTDYDTNPFNKISFPIGVSHPPGNYKIIASGRYTNNEMYTNISHFTVTSSGFPTTMGSSDVLTVLGYASGKVDGGSPTVTGFITNLSSTNNDHYNGQILRFTNGNLIGQGRIISDYNGTSKMINLNKGLSFAPSSGDIFVIMPIGGEYNVS